MNREHAEQEVACLADAWADLILSCFAPPSNRQVQLEGAPFRAGLG